MKKKIVSILVCMLLTLTIFIPIPEKTNVSADSGDAPSEDIGLDYEYLWEQIENIAEVIYDAYQLEDIRKGRQFGSTGDYYTRHDLIAPELNSIGLNDVHEERIQHINGKEPMKNVHRKHTYLL